MKHRQARRQRHIDPPRRVRVERFEQAIGAATIVVPTKVAEDRVQAKPLDRHAGGLSGEHFGGNILQPRGPVVAFGAGFSDE